VVLGFDVSSTLASTLKLDLSGGVTSAANIKMNNASQTLDIGPSTTLTISAVETIAKGTLHLSGGTVNDALGIIVGGNGAAGKVSGFGTITANLSGNGAVTVVDTFTASGGTLDFTGTFAEGAGGTFKAVIDSTTSSTLKFDNTAALDQPVVINSALQTLEIGAAGALTMTGLDLVTNGTIRLDGGSIADTSGIVIDTAATLIGRGFVPVGTPLSGDGTVKASGGILRLGSALTTPNTNFAVDSVAGSVLRIGATVASLVTTTFIGSSGALELANVSGGVVQGFNGTIAGLNVGASATGPTNSINIQASVTKALLTGSTITAFNGSTLVATLALGATPVHGAYAVVAHDATLGGTDVFLTNQPPAAPAALALTLGADSGTKGDRITNIATPQITGTGVPGDTIQLFKGATPMGSGIVRGGGNWFITTATLAEGVNAITATQTDAFGNISAHSVALNVTLDTVAPVAPAIDRLTASSLFGTAEANAKVTAFDGLTQLGTAVANGTGRWSIPAALAAGTHALTAQATDRAGNIGPASTAIAGVIGTPGNDALAGGPGVAFMVGGAGNDTYTVNNPADAVTEAVGGGSDTVLTSVSYALAAGTEIEFLTANAGSTGLALTGNDFANTIQGGSGNDVLRANAGDDTITGGAGNDTMSGGAGNDVFKFLTGFGHDFITDFDSNPLGGQDLLDISALGITAATFASAVTISGGATALITIGSDSIRLNAVNQTTVDMTDFRLAV
jgi:Ca2+-binding RTX toxin-like protein